MTFQLYRLHACYAVLVPRLTGRCHTSYITLKYIYIRNPLSLDLSPKNCLIKSSLTFTTQILLNLSLSILLLSINRLTISYNYLTITSYKLVSTILVSVPNLDIVAVVNSIVTGAFSSIILTYRSFQYNYSSNYITKPLGSTTVSSINRLGIQLEGVNN